MLSLVHIYLCDLTPHALWIGITHPRETKVFGSLNQSNVSVCQYQTSTVSKT